LKLDPSHYQSQVNLAIILEKEGKGSDAQTYYYNALQQNPEEANIYHNLGINLKRAGKLEEALE
jgi:Tfp pilus assembly protein PilF